MRFEPSAVPTTFPGLRRWLAEMLRDIANALASPSLKSLHLEALAAEPDKYQDGDLVRANGSDWDPGSGEGVYCRLSGAWVKL